MSSSTVSFTRLVIFSFCRCELRIVSDANDFFIDTILQKHGVQHLFSRIHTNPSFIDEGRIHIGPYHKKHWRSHGCPLCPPNMCKVIVIDSNANTYFFSLFYFISMFVFFLGREWY